MLYELRRWRARRPSVIGGLDFVNAVLEEAGRPMLSVRDYAAFRDELLGDSDLAAAFRAAQPVQARLAPSKAERFAKPFPDFVRDHARAALDTFYVLIRALRPERMVETGVHTGHTTSLILAAMNHAGFGHLTSVDLPSIGGMQHIAISDNETGLLVPQSFRDRWTLVRDNSLYVLPALLRDVKPTVFFHDSDHSYRHMAFEYGLAASLLPKGGVIISDDTTMNDAFYDLAGGLGVKQVRHSGNKNFSVCVTR